MKFEPVVIQSVVARWALAILVLLWSLAGWWIIVAGGLHLSLDRRSRLPVLVDGAPALFMAMIFLALATVTAAVLLHNTKFWRNGLALSVVLNIVLPLLYWIVS